MLFGQHPESFDEFCRTHYLNMPDYRLKLPSLEHLANFFVAVESLLHEISTKLVENTLKCKCIVLMHFVISNISNI